MQRDHIQVVALVDDLTIEGLGVFAQVLKVALAVASVHDDKDISLFPIQEHVVDRVAILQAEQRVANRADGDLRAVIRRDRVDHRNRVRPNDVVATHMAQVEQAACVANDVDLVEDWAVLDGHMPASEVDHARAKSGVNVVKRGLFHGLKVGYISGALERWAILSGHLCKSDAGATGA